MHPSPNPAPILGKIARSYTRKPLLDPNPTIPAPPAVSSSYRADQSTWTLQPATLTPLDSASTFSHQQPRLRAPAQTVENKLPVLPSSAELPGHIYKSQPTSCGSIFLFIFTFPSAQFIICFHSFLGVLLVVVRHVSATLTAYIVVGAGAGGGPLASRLSINGFKVLLIYMGHYVFNDNTTIPLYLARCERGPADGARL
ncbi:hypothetical protein B0H14DRAFT_3482630 [Mycena olivaceomarginata]|nr:hypothetical protein B0H14DRAFT_3482630 [Mycena olivaceomarginata]